MYKIARETKPTIQQMCTPAPLHCLLLLVLVLKTLNDQDSVLLCYVHFVEVEGVGAEIQRNNFECEI